MAERMIGWAVLSASPGSTSPTISPATIQPDRPNTPNGRELPLSVTHRIQGNGVG